MSRGLHIVFLVLAICFSGVAFAASPVPDPLLEAYSGPWQPPDVDQTLVARQRLVTVRLDLIRLEPGAALLLNLFDDARVSVLCAEVGAQISGSRIWLGRGADPDPAEVILAVGEQTISGRVSMPGKLFHIRPLEDGVHVVREISAPTEQDRPKRTRHTRQDVEWENAGLVNQERRINGLHDLAWDGRLSTSARGHSADMAARGYFAHDSLDGRTAGDRMTAAGYVWNAWRENIAAGQTTSAAVHTAWMNSPGHKKNILDAVICDIGVGYAYDGASQYKHYWTQNFGRKQGVSTCPPVDNPPGPRPDPDPDPDPEPGVLNNLGWVNAFYVAYWGRSPDPDGLAYWMGEIASGRLSVPGVAEVFAMSAEAKAVYPYFKTPHAATNAERGAFVRAVYVNLLNREPDTAGLNYWVGVLRSGASTPGLVIGNIINAAMTAGGTDWLVIRNKVEVANYFAWKFGQGGYIWNDAARRAAIAALDGVTSDPATVNARKAWVDELMS